MVWREPGKLDAHEGYRLTALKPKLAPRVEELRQALRSDRRVIFKSSREGFYEVLTPGGWYLVHISDAFRAIYLVAHAQINEIEPQESAPNPAKIALPA